VLSVENIYKSYGDNKVLEGVTFRIPRGEIFTLVGAKGAGKTTLLEIISGFTPPDKGDVFIDGVNCRKQKRQAKALYGYVPKTLGLYEKLTVLEYMEFFAAMNGCDGEQTIHLRRNLLDFANLLPQAMSPISKLNKGDKEKLAIIRAMIHNPKVLIIDEPFYGLNVEQAYEVKDMLDNIANIGRTIFMTSDNINLAAGISTSIGIMNNGRMISNEEMGMIYETLTNNLVNGEIRENEQNYIEDTQDDEYDENDFDSFNSYNDYDSVNYQDNFYDR